MAARQEFALLCEKTFVPEGCQSVCFDIYGRVCFLEKDKRLFNFLKY